MSNIDILIPPGTTQSEPGSSMPSATEEGSIPVYTGEAWEAGVDKDIKAKSVEASDAVVSGDLVSGAQMDAEVLAGSNTETGNAYEINPDDGLIFNDAEVTPAMLKSLMAGIFHPTHYTASSVWAAKTVTTAADRYTLEGPEGGNVRVGDMNLSWTEAPSLDLSVAANWDTQTPTDYTVAAARAGMNGYVYACQPASGNTPVWKVSANSTVPDGYTADTSRKVAGWHCECCDIGTIASHPLTGYLAGDIIPTSVWDLTFRADGQQEGMAYVAPKRRWVAIYPPSGTGANTASAYNAVISDTRSWLDFNDDFSAIKCQMLRDHEFQEAAEGSNQQTNIYGSQDPVRTGMIGTLLFTGAGLNDMAVSAAGLTANNVEIEIEIDAEGTPDTFKWRSKVFGGSFGGYTTGVAITGSAQTIVNGVTVTFTATTGHTATNKWNVYAMKAGYDTAARRMVSNYGHEMMCGVMWQWLDEQSYRFDGAANHTHQIVVSGEPETVTSGNPSGDVGPGWSWHAVGSNKGAINKQGTYGDVKQSAGGIYSYGSLCGSRSRDESFYRWITNAIGSSRACSPPRIVAQMSGGGSAAPSAAQIVTLEDSANITPNLSAGTNFQVTLGGNRALAAPINATVGQSGFIRIIQDGTGSRSLSFDSVYKFTAGVDPELTTTASAVDSLKYIVHSSTFIECSLSTNLA